MARTPALIARKGDTGTHGGSVTTGAARTFAESNDINKTVARVGDTYACPIHGNNPIKNGSKETTVEGALCAHHGSETNCGATIIASATRTYVDKGTI